MKTKEIIKKAYGEHYSSFKDMMDENGWVLDKDYWWMDAEDLFDIETEEENLGYGNYVTIKWRPRLIEELEDNNGWIRIESEKDLPKESGDYFIIDRDGNMHISFYSVKYKDFSQSCVEYVTHYQAIVKPKPPLY